jgi:hypothetical protein
MFSQIAISPNLVSLDPIVSYIQRRLCAFENKNSFSSVFLNKLLRIGFSAKKALPVIVGSPEWMQSSKSWQVDVIL